MVNALFPRDLAAHVSHFFRHHAKTRALTATGVVAAGIGVFGFIALGLPSAPQSQTLAALAPTLETPAAALFEPPTFSDRFAADVKDLPPTVGVGGSAMDDPRAARLAEYAAALKDGARESRVPLETTGARQ